MSNITILIEYLWTSSYQPWLSSSYPWATIGSNEKLGISKLRWNNADNSWETTYTTWDDSSDTVPLIVEGSGISVSVNEETLTIALQSPTIVEGLGNTVISSTESLVINIQDPIIVEGQGISFLASADALSISTESPEILFGYTVFPNAENFIISVVPPRYAGSTYEVIIKPTTVWGEISKDESSIWEYVGQILWSFRVKPWESTFYPWLSSSDIITWASIIESGLRWEDATMTWEEFTKNWDGMNTIHKPNTNYIKIKDIN